MFGSMRKWCILGAGRLGRSGRWSREDCKRDPSSVAAQEVSSDEEPYSPTWSQSDREGEGPDQARDYGGAVDDRLFADAEYAEIPYDPEADLKEFEQRLESAVYDGLVNDMPATIEFIQLALERAYPFIRKNAPGGEPIEKIERRIPAEGSLLANMTGGESWTKYWQAKSVQDDPRPFTRPPPQSVRGQRRPRASFAQVQRRNNDDWDNCPIMQTGPSTSAHATDTDDGQQIRRKTKGRPTRERVKSGASRRKVKGPATGRMKLRNPRGSDTDTSGKRYPTPERNDWNDKRRRLLTDSETDIPIKKCFAPDTSDLTSQSGMDVSDSDWDREVKDRGSDISDSSTDLTVGQNWWNDPKQGNAQTLDQIRYCLIYRKRRTNICLTPLL
ncbi:unnamed protein product [Ilex paraguariensis]|uniref:Uncharacterized protein n=1 Tax=Ilex paraguariensis TaxID=185542 RepID=A0ABC8UZK6_9AQUA